jgi:NAD(P)-dependent dehydrogenase (short-subunit alcohol dehydrogenase family)
MSRRWLITGCSTGLGRALAEAAAASGQRVIATARRLETLEHLTNDYPANVVMCKLDVCDAVDCAIAISTAVKAFGGVDVLVNNAGYAQFGTVEEIGDAELEAQFATNLFGAWRMTRLVLPLMRAQGHGDILMVGSRTASPGLPAYAASKRALEGMADALRLELAGTGVDVTVLEPGAFATRLGPSAVEPRRHVAAYSAMVEPALATLRAGEGSPPSILAEAVLRFLDGERRPPRLPIGTDPRRSWTRNGEFIRHSPT